MTTVCVVLAGLLIAALLRISVLKDEAKEERVFDKDRLEDIEIVVKYNKKEDIYAICFHNTNKKSKIKPVALIIRDKDDIAFLTTVLENVKKEYEESEDKKQ